MHSLSFSVDHTDLQFDSNDLDGDAAIVILSLTLVYPSEIRSSPPDGVLRSVWSLRIAERSASVYSNQPTGPIGAIRRAKGYRGDSHRHLHVRGFASREAV